MELQRLKIETRGTVAQKQQYFPIEPVHFI